jgi:diguanylate cyclase (GGDEF)-like protein
VALANAERERSVLALMFVDLDRFKPVNDQYGHHVGDLLLKAVAERILACLRHTDSAARFGGDEFVVMLPDVARERYAMRIAEKIRTALNRPFEIEGLTLNISSSTGVAVYPDHADEEQLLIKRADIAMYFAKAEGRNRVKAYRPAMDRQKPGMGG